MLNEEVLDQIGKMDLFEFPTELKVECSKSEMVGYLTTKNSDISIDTVDFIDNLEI